jgi:hypothetical protein
MATVNNPNPSKAQIKLVKGTNPLNGKTIYTTETLSDLRTTATDDDIRTICTSIASMIDLPLDSIIRVNSGSLVAG